MRVVHQATKHRETDLAQADPRMAVDPAVESSSALSLTWKSRKCARPINSSNLWKVAAYSEGVPSAYPAANT